MWKVLGLLVAVALLLVILIPGLQSSCISTHEDNARASLQSVASALARFRKKDLDGNGRNDYWRCDIAGLYAHIPAASSQPMRLIDVGIALADVSPLTNVESAFERGPKARYFFRALRFPDENQATLDPDRFAVHTFPEQLDAGKHMFIITHKGIVWKKPAVLGGVQVAPSDPSAEGWWETSTR